MGGCRCTYRNCVMKSDGKTHMFHYPVFEKVRCHQWLVNAQKLEFLNLKVSQLKNRVVCQHHFKDENFMNFKKDKLTFDAIPTENGPFCDPSKFLDNNEAAKDYSDILLEDIENDYVFNDKKANYSLKYGVFLTNNDLVDPSSHYTSKNINLTKENPVINLNSRLSPNNERKFVESSFRAHGPKLLLPVKNTKLSQPMLVVPPYSNLNNEQVQMYNDQNLEQNIIITVPHMDQIVQDNNIIPQYSNEELNVKNNATGELGVSVKKEPKFKILSEKKICGPIALTGKFDKMSPAITLNLSDKFPIVTKVEHDQETNKKTNSQEAIDKPSDKLKILEVLEVEFDMSQQKPNPVQKTETKTGTDTIIDTSTLSPSKKNVQVKNKVTPERSAAIERKRKFNLKLKNVIESCLDKLDDPVKINEICPTASIDTTVNDAITHSIKPEKNRIVKTSDDQENSKIAKEPNEPSAQDKTIAFLEVRMKQMERTLLNKIEQNTQKIMELKESFGNTSAPKQLSKIKSDAAKSITSENSYKKFLYQQISEYLSPSSNSLIYEELFINKYSPDETKSLLKRKRRKCS